ncbi:hypothetical protein KIPB_006269, partial [Kipferlia bialata]
QCFKCMSTLLLAAPELVMGAVPDNDYNKVMVTVSSGVSEPLSVSLVLRLVLSGGVRSLTPEAAALLTQVAWLDNVHVPQKDMERQGMVYRPFCVSAAPLPLLLEVVREATQTLTEQVYVSRERDTPALDDGQEERERDRNSQRSLSVLLSHGAFPAIVTSTIHLVTLCSAIQVSLHVGGNASPRWPSNTAACLSGLVDAMCTPSQQPRETEAEAEGEAEGEGESVDDTPVDVDREDQREREKVVNIVTAAIGLGAVNTEYLLPSLSARENPRVLCQAGSVGVPFLEALVTLIIDRPGDEGEHQQGEGEPLPGVSTLARSAALKVLFHVVQFTTALSVFCTQPSCLNGVFMQIAATPRTEENQGLPRRIDELLMVVSALFQGLLDSYHRGYAATGVSNGDRRVARTAYETCFPVILCMIQDSIYDLHTVAPEACLRLIRICLMTPVVGSPSSKTSVAAAMLIGSGLTGVVAQFVHDLFAKKDSETETEGEGEGETDAETLAAKRSRTLRLATEALSIVKDTYESIDISDHVLAGATVRDGVTHNLTALLLNLKARRVAEIQQGTERTVRRALFIEALRALSLSSFGKTSPEVVKVYIAIIGNSNVELMNRIEVCKHLLFVMSRDETARQSFLNTGDGPQSGATAAMLLASACANTAVAADHGEDSLSADDLARGTAFSLRSVCLSLLPLVNGDDPVALDKLLVAITKSIMDSGIRVNNPYLFYNLLCSSLCVDPQTKSCTLRDVVPILLLIRSLPSSPPAIQQTILSDLLHLLYTGVLQFSHSQAPKTPDAEGSESALNEARLMDELSGEMSQPCKVPSTGDAACDEAEKEREHCDPVAGHYLSRALASCPSVVRSLLSLLVRTSNAEHYNPLPHTVGIAPASTVDTPTAADTPGEAEAEAEGEREGEGQDTVDADAEVDESSSSKADHVMTEEQERQQTTTTVTALAVLTKLLSSVEDPTVAASVLNDLATLLPNQPLTALILSLSQCRATSPAPYAGMAVPSSISCSISSSVVVSSPLVRPPTPSPFALSFWFSPSMLPETTGQEQISVPLLEMVDDSGCVLKLDLFPTSTHTALLRYSVSVEGELHSVTLPHSDRYIVCTGEGGLVRRLARAEALESGLPPTLGDWCHIALSHSGDDLTFWVNGHPTPAGCFPPVPLPPSLVSQSTVKRDQDGMDTDPLTVSLLGTQYTMGENMTNRPFVGLIGPLRVYSTTLCSTDVEYMYQNPHFHSEVLSTSLDLNLDFAQLEDIEKTGLGAVPRDAALQHRLARSLPLSDVGSNILSARAPTVAHVTSPVTVPLGADIEAEAEEGGAATIVLSLPSLLYRGRGMERVASDVNNSVYRTYASSGVANISYTSIMSSVISIVCPSRALAEEANRGNLDPLRLSSPGMLIPCTDPLFSCISASMALGVELPDEVEPHRVSKQTQGERPSAASTVRERGRLDFPDVVGSLMALVASSDPSVVSTAVSLLLQSWPRPTVSSAPTHALSPSDKLMQEMYEITTSLSPVEIRPLPLHPCIGGDNMAMVSLRARTFPFAVYTHVTFTSSLVRAAVMKSNATPCAASAIGALLEYLLP